MNLSIPDIVVLSVYLGGLMSLGLWCARRTRTSDAFMTAGRVMSGWALALTLFGSFVSSISFLAQPGKSYADNWNPFVFCFALPIAAMVGAFIFVPFYRKSGDVSAYSHLEARFGPWARTYCTLCFILLQLTRTGVVTYLLAMALTPAFGWEATNDREGMIIVIVAIGVVMTVFPLFGGTAAAVWTGVLQSIVLALGMILSLITVFLKMPHGVGEVFAVASRFDKFSLGSYEPSLVGPTVLVVFLYALVENLKNFGVNQTYVQLYATARSERDARACVWVGALMYVPLAAMTYMVGTALFAFYTAQPDLLPAGIRADQVFPHFIHTQLPVGVKGLVLAAVAAAATDSSFNCIATLVHGDIYKRYFRPQASERESMWVLRLSTIACGFAAVAVSVGMLHVRQALDAWWALAGIMAGGMLGLFLLGRLSRSAGPASAVIGVVIGTLAILWMTASLESFAATLRAFIPGFGIPRWFIPWRFPWHEFMIPVIGTTLVLAFGWLAAFFWKRPDTRN